MKLMIMDTEKTASDQTKTNIVAHLKMVIDRIENGETTGILLFEAKANGDWERFTNVNHSSSKLLWLMECYKLKLIKESGNI